MLPWTGASPKSTSDRSLVNSCSFLLRLQLTKSSSQPDDLPPCHSRASRRPSHNLRRRRLLPLRPNRPAASLRTSSAQGPRPPRRRRRGRNRNSLPARLLHLLLSSVRPSSPLLGSVSSFADLENAHSNRLQDAPQPPLRALPEERLRPPRRPAQEGHPAQLVDGERLPAPQEPQEQRDRVGVHEAAAACVLPLPVEAEEARADRVFSFLPQLPRL